MIGRHNRLELGRAGKYVKVDKALCDEKGEMSGEGSEALLPYSHITFYNDDFFENVENKLPE